MTKRTPSPEPPPTINDICTGDVGGELLLFVDPRALCRCEAVCRTWRRALYSNGATRAWEACIRRDHGDDVMRILKDFEAPRGPAWMRTRRAYRGLADPGPDPTGKGPAVECDWDVGPYGTGGTYRMPRNGTREPTAIILEVRSVSRRGPFLRSMALLDNLDLQQIMADGDLNQEEAARRARAVMGSSNIRAAGLARWARPDEFPRESDEHEYEHLAVWEPTDVSFDVPIPIVPPEAVTEADPYEDAAAGIQTACYLVSPETWEIKVLWRHGLPPRDRGVATITRGREEGIIATGNHGAGVYHVGVAPPPAGPPRAHGGRRVYATQPTGFCRFRATDDLRMHLFRFAVNFAPATREYRGRGHLARLLKNVMERETSARRLPPARRSAEVYLQRRVAILEKQVKSLRLAAGALAEAAYLGDTLEPSDSEDEMEAESDLDNGDEEVTDLVSDGEDA